MPRLAQRQPDVGRPDDLGGELAETLSELQAEHARAGGPQHRSEHLLHPGQARDGGRLARRRRSARPPSRPRCARRPARPAAATPASSARSTPPGSRPRPWHYPGEGGRLVQPQLGQRDRFGQRALLSAVRAGIGTERGGGLAGGVLGHLPVDAGVRAGRRRRTSNQRRRASRTRSAAATARAFMSPPASEENSASSGLAGWSPPDPGVGPSPSTRRTRPAGTARAWVPPAGRRTGPAAGPPPSVSLLT